MNLFFLKDLWNLNKPRLIISVTGGATLDIKQEFRTLIDVFCKGLIKVASSIGNFNFTILKEILASI